MPRKYTRKTDMGLVPHERMLDAVKAVVAGTKSIRKAANDGDYEVEFLRRGRKNNTIRLSDQQLKTLHQWQSKISGLCCLTPWEEQPNAQKGFSHSRLTLESLICAKEWNENLPHQKVWQHYIFLYDIVLTLNTFLLSNFNLPKI